MSTQKKELNESRPIPCRFSCCGNTAALDGERLLVETRAMARRLPSFNGLLHAARAMAKEAGLVEPSLMIATTIHLPGAVYEPSYRAPWHWHGKN